MDKNLSIDDSAECCGATSSVAIFHSLDAPSTTFFSADKLSLTVAHCGWVNSFNSQALWPRMTGIHVCYCPLQMAALSFRWQRITMQILVSSLYAYAGWDLLSSLIHSGTQGDDPCPWSGPWFWYCFFFRWMGVLANTRWYNTNMPHKCKAQATLV